MSNKNFLMLHSDSSFSQDHMRNLRFKENFTFLDAYDLPNYDLSETICMVINGLTDQEFLYREKEIIRQFLDQGKVLLFGGHLFREWLPGAKVFIPKSIQSHQDYVVSVAQPHPIFEGVLTKDMTFTKGVSGFFARGHHPLPPGAEGLLSLPGGELITYIDRQSTRGTIIVHAGNDLLAYNDLSTTTSRIGAQLISWIREEHSRIAKRRVHS
jgi:hypothetical protein